MKNIGIVVNNGKPRADEVVARIEAAAAVVGLQVVFVRDAGLKTADTDAALDGCDVVMALGGDGTMLRTVRLLDGRSIPVMGINIGSLGFLTTIAENEIESALKMLAEGAFSIRPRCIAEATVMREGRKIAGFRALNEILVSRGISPRVVTLDVAVNGDRVASYVCDGIIVSTPSGSTGHSLSAGGPILHPDAGVFVVSLICPHTLSSRPLVVCDSSQIEVGSTAAGGVRLAVDGQVEHVLEDSDSIIITRSAKAAQFVILPGFDYFSVLRRKLSWSVRQLPAAE